VTATETPAHQLIEAVRALLPLVRDTADQAERERRMPDTLGLALAEAGVFRMLAPRCVGGLELDPIAAMDLIELLSRADGSAGWVAGINLSSSIVAGFLPPEAGRAIFGDDPHGAMAGTLAIPAGRAVPIDGGYRVSGRWPFASGCHNATWLACSAIVHDGDAPWLDADRLPVMRVVVFPRSETIIHDTWYPGGLRGTGSHDVEIRDLVVPQARTFWWDRPAHPGPLYRARWYLMMHAAHALGLARAAIDALVDLAGRKVPTRSTSLLRDRPLAQMQLAQAEALVQSAHLLAWQTTARLWEQACAGQPLSIRDMATIRLANTQAVTASAQAVDLMYSAAGGTAVYTTSPLERIFRDIHAATQHAMVAPQTYELLGRVLLHPEPESLPRQPGPPLF
jgi:alkylation response protein AidB-like acyl-CoA dehydrogenase